MILISASDNNSWRHYRLRALATIRAWAYALRTCSDATLGRDTRLAPAQGMVGLFQPPIPTSGQLRRAKATIQVSCTSALNYDALWRFCAMDFSASGQKRRLCRRSTRTLMANLPFQSHHRYAISLSFPTTQVCYRVQSKDVRFHFGFISCWSARSQCVRLARPTRCSSSPARPVY